MFTSLMMSWLFTCRSYSTSASFINFQSESEKEPIFRRFFLIIGLDYKQHSTSFFMRLADIYVYGCVCVYI